MWIDFVVSLHVNAEAYILKHHPASELNYWAHTDLQIRGGATERKVVRNVTSPTSRPIPPFLILTGSRVITPGNIFDNADAFR